MIVESDQPRFASDPANHGSDGAVRGRLRDRVLWVLAALIVLCVIAHFVARTTRSTTVGTTASLVATSRKRCRTT